MRILTRSGPYIAAMPAVVEELGDCRLCREHAEVSAEAVKAVHNGEGRRGLQIAHEWESQIEGHSCQKWVDDALMAPRRGRWLAVRVEVGVYDQVLKADYRLPIARADCLAEGDGETPSRFRVVNSPGGDGEGRTAQWFLDGLDRDERAHLLADLKEV